MRTGAPSEDQEGWSLLTAGADDLEWMAMHVARLGFDVEILEPPALREAAAALAQRLEALTNS